MEAPYSSEEEKMRLLDLYRYMHSRIHSTSRPLKLIYHVAERETLLAWVRAFVYGNSYCSSHVAPFAVMGNTATFVPHKQI